MARAIGGPYEGGMPNDPVDSASLARSLDAMVPRDAHALVTAEAVALAWPACSAASDPLPWDLTISTAS